MKPVTVSRRVRATPDAVFRHFTERIDRWWVRRTTPWGSDGDPLAMEPREGGTVTEGGEIVGSVETWQPGVALAFTLRGTRIEVELTALDDGTELVLRHSGWERWTDTPGRQAFFDLVSVYWLDAMSRIGVGSPV